MKTIIAGGRGLWNYWAVADAVQCSQIKISEVVSGAAPGADTLGELWARSHDVPVKQFPADWNTHGKSAGTIRNAQMAEYAQALIAIWDGESPGTRHMINTAKKRGLHVFVYRYDPQTQGRSQ